jgi:hypothetical protein
MQARQCVPAHGRSVGLPESDAIFRLASKIIAIATPLVAVRLRCFGAARFARQIRDAAPRRGMAIAYGGLRTPRHATAQSPKNFRKKYRRFTMENARQLQRKSLRRLRKSARAKNNGKQWKKQCAEQWKQSAIRARADASPGHIAPQKQIARRREAPGAHVRD